MRSTVPLTPDDLAEFNRGIQRARAAYYGHMRYLEHTKPARTAMSLAKLARKAAAQKRYRDGKRAA